MQDISPRKFTLTCVFKYLHEKLSYVLWAAGKMWIQSRERACASVPALRAVESSPAGKSDVKRVHPVVVVTFLGLQQLCI